MKTLSNDEIELIDIVLSNVNESINNLCEVVLINNLCWWLFDFNKLRWDFIINSESIYYEVLDFYFSLYKEKLWLNLWYHDYIFWNDEWELFKKIKSYEWNELYITYFNKKFNYD